MSIAARTARFVLVLLCLLGWRNRALAQAQPEPRVIDLFDFEDPLNGNLEDDPIGWRKLEGPGLPHYLNGKFDREVKSSGQFSYRLDLDGGSLIYRYPAGRLEVRRGGLYRVSALVRTTQLEHARPAITAWLADEDGQPIAGTRVRQSLAFGSNFEWKSIALEISNNTIRARSLVVEFGLLQPAQLNLDRPDAPDLLVEDIHGSAWFDDLSIMEVPDIRLSTPHAGNFFGPGEPMRVRIELRDRITSDLSIGAVVRDVDGRTVFQKSGGWTWQADGSNESSTTIELPVNEPGWYGVDLHLMSGTRVVSEVSTSVVRLAQVNGPHDRRFGFVATDLPISTWQSLPDMIDSLAGGQVKLSVWDHQTAIESSTDSTTFDRVLDGFERRGIRIVGCLRALPPAVAQSLGGSEFERALHSTSWKNQLAYLISRHASRITSWQLLDDSSAERIAREPMLRLLHDQVYGEMASLLETPDLALPWPAWAELDNVLGKSIALTVPDSILPRQIPMYVDSFRQSDPDRLLAIDLTSIDAARYGLTAQRRDLAQRIVYALASDAQRIELPLPLIDKQGRAGPALDPTPLAPMIRTLFGQLSETHFAGRVPLGAGIDALLFSRDRQSGVLVLWSREESRRISLLVGGSPMKIDLNGKLHRLEMSSKPGEIELDLSPEPILLVGVDAQLLRLQSTLAIDRPFIESSFRSHQRRLTFVNPFDRALSGSIRVRGPRGWACSLIGQFNLNPGERFDEPLTIDLPSNAIVGEQTMFVDLKFNGSDEFRMTVPIPIQLSLDEIGLQTVAQRVGGEIFVQQVITNYGDKPIDYNAFVLCPGVARQERLVSGLAPGMSMLKKYRFAAPKNPAATLRSGLRQLDGAKMINEEVTVN